MTMGGLQVVTGLVLGIHQFCKNVVIPIALKPWDVGLLPRCMRVDTFHCNITVGKYAKVTPLTTMRLLTAATGPDGNKDRHA